jgi:hypothetical protein
MAAMSNQLAAAMNAAACRTTANSGVRRRHAARPIAGKRWTPKAEGGTMARTVSGQARRLTAGLAGALAHAQDLVGACRQAGQASDDQLRQRRAFFSPCICA